MNTPGSSKTPSDLSRALGDPDAAAARVETGANLPLVSVVTPFYNTADYLEGCIRSVLRQTYETFEYVLVDNQSDDGSRELAERFASEDARIRLVHNSRHVGQVANYNIALRSISAESKYCKIVQADDEITGDCLAEMVAAAESSPRVGLVGASAMFGDQLNLENREFGQSIYSGQQAARIRLLRLASLFDGNPSTVMYRSEIVRGRDDFFVEGRSYEDVEVCFDILMDWDFAFVHKVLSHVRVDNESIMSRITRTDPRWYLCLHLLLLDKYGPQFLSKEEAVKSLRRKRFEYCAAIGESVVEGRADREFWELHARMQREAGVSIRGIEIALCYLREKLLTWRPPWDTAARGWKALVRRIALPQRRSASSHIDEPRMP